MKKLELLILLAFCALVALVYSSQSSSRLTPRPGSTPSLTASGRWEVLVGPYQLAGLSMGAAESEILTQLGEPTEKRVDHPETHQWIYRSDGGELVLTLLEGRLVSAGSLNGRWSLSEEGQARPGFMASPSEILKALGKPLRTEQHDTVWIYSRRPGELTFHFENDRVSQIIVTGEIKPRAPKSAP